MFIAFRQMSGHGPRTMPMQPSRFQWHKFKDMFHYYVMVGAIPVTAVVFYTNVFIGEATLSETPEDYVPKHWEYHRVSLTAAFKYSVMLIRSYFSIQLLVLWQDTSMHRLSSNTRSIVTWSGKSRS